MSVGAKIFAWCKFRWQTTSGNIKAGVCLAMIGTVVTVFGLARLEATATQAVPDPPEIAPSPPLGILIVEVSGAVVQPGIYQLQLGDRWAHALGQAGGLLPQADKQYVSQRLNLAASPQDGDKLHIPFQGEIETGKSSAENEETHPSAADVSISSAQISLNTASLEELDTLPGIGPQRAQAIIDNRPYASVEELVERQVVGIAVYDEIKALVGL